MTSGLFDVSLTPPIALAPSIRTEPLVQLSRPRRASPPGPSGAERATRLGVSVQRNLRLYAQEADILPVVRAVSEEALRMLDAYINRTDELHPWSTELLAQAFSATSEPMPPVGAKVPIPDLNESTIARSTRDSIGERLREAAEYATENQIRLAETRAQARRRVLASLGGLGGLLNRQV